MKFNSSLITNSQLNLLSSTYRAQRLLHYLRPSNALLPMLDKPDFRQTFAGITVDKSARILPLRHSMNIPLISTKAVNWGREMLHKSVKL